MGLYEKGSWEWPHLDGYRALEDCVFWCGTNATVSSSTCALKKKQGHILTINYSGGKEAH
jgi:hypothetical protein